MLVKKIAIMHLAGDEMHYFFHHNEWIRSHHNPGFGYILDVKEYDLDDAWHPLQKGDMTYAAGVISRTRYYVSEAIRTAKANNIDYLWVKDS
jgi:hypothetical protein